MEFSLVKDSLHSLIITIIATTEYDFNWWHNDTFLSLNKSILCSNLKASVCIRAYSTMQQTTPPTQLKRSLWATLQTPRCPFLNPNHNHKSPTDQSDLAVFLDQPCSPHVNPHLLSFLTTDPWQALPSS